MDFIIKSAPNKKTDAYSKNIECSFYGQKKKTMQANAFIDVDQCNLV